jgi:type IV pilus assembly protein PilY1
MKKLLNRWQHIAGTSVLTLWCCLAQADDIEVYRGEASGVRPIMMMVIDTSGSMSYWETETAPEFDASIDYSSTYPSDDDGDAIDYPFEKGTYYFTDEYSGGDLSDSDISDLEDRPFPPEALVCEDAIVALEETGYYSDSFKRWDTDNKVWDPSEDTLTYVSKKKGGYYYWDSPDIPTGDASATDAIIECKSDEDDHPTGKYVNTDADSSYQYSSTKADNYNTTWDNNFRYVYSGNYLNYKIYITYFEISNTQSRMQITQSAATDVVDSTGGIRIGLARFDIYSNGGMVDIAVDDIEDVRDEFTDKIDTYLPWGGTPLTETYYEMALYFQGADVDNGEDSDIRLQNAGTTLERADSGFIYQNTNNKSNTTEESSPSVSSSTSSGGTTYVSPIESACQSTSGIVLFTDGEPTGDDDMNTEIKALLTAANIDFSTNSTLTSEDREVLTNNCSGDGGCAEELAYYLANVDQRPDLAGSQVVQTHVIGGFFSDDGSASDALTRMENIAKYGNGTYTSASNKDEIEAAFKASVAAVVDNPVTFVAPAVSANAYNSLEHLDDLYYAMFVPSADNNWQGNLKSYRLSSDGVVVDAEGDDAIGSGGLFNETSRSYWTAEGTEDGGDVVIGGAASNLTHDLNIFTHLTDSQGVLNTEITADTVTRDLLGLESTTSDEDHLALIDWLNRRSDDETRTQMEDPLHSQPIVVNYSYTTDVDNNTVTADGVVFVGTNSGYLHAFKADKNNFKEYFSFMPQELLANAELYRTNDTDESKPYGVDGPINYWHVDTNQNSQVDEDEKVYLFFGLRRGGRHYYALDISDPEAPRFQWKISGGLGDDFDKMGQSWSPMTLAKVNWEGKTKVVLLFGGGYDPTEDDQLTRTEHTMGNAVYMIDPETGDLLWSASDSDATTNLKEMTSAITSQIKPVDFDGDQITDYFFVSDIGGRIWRFDINPETEDKSDFIAGAGMLFDANEGSNDYQRFYYSPSVSYFVDPTGDQFLTLAIGSGFRAHPLQATTQDSFYIIKDSYIVKAPTTYETLERDDLHFIPEDNQLTSAVSTSGWYFDLSAGEKVMSSPLTANGNMYFTTFAPLISNADANTCNADVGQSMAYTVDFLGDDDPNQDSISPVISGVTLPSIGIAPQPIEVTTTDTFCVLNPSHESCLPDPCEETNTCPEEDECEETGSVILSGTNTISGGITRCELLKKDYWRSL